MRADGKHFENPMTACGYLSEQLTQERRRRKQVERQAYDLLDLLDERSWYLDRWRSLCKQANRNAERWMEAYESVKSMNPTQFTFNKIFGAFVRRSDR
jgi:hypothetical protein